MLGRKKAKQAVGEGVFVVFLKALWRLVDVDQVREVVAGLLEPYPAPKISNSSPLKFRAYSRPIWRRWRAETRKAESNDMPAFN